MSITIKSLNNYKIRDLIHESSRTVVYSGLTKADGEPVIIKLMRNNFPSFNELVQFRNQYTIARNLQIEGIVKPLALERYENGYALIMPDLGSISLAEYYQSLPSETSNISEFLDIAIQITEILYELHQNRIIHKDIKPANILINPETKQVKIIDFSISSLLPKETQTIQTPNVLEGTLAYISPEQTGRMNRGIDYRSDFYSLGVTFFEMLNRKLPYETTDPMELIHCHLAVLPIIGRKEEGSLARLEPTPNSSWEGNLVHGAEIPQMLMDIVVKLMAKNAEDRYQSALGLKYDLERCRQEWQEKGEIEDFELGSRDISDRFLIPEKLYGREAEVQTLLDAFEEISNPPRNSSHSASPPLPLSPSPRLLLVAGFSGIGKTAVVNEVHKPIVKQRGYFVKGKFDQFNRHVPFSALVESLRDLMAQILSESDSQLRQWKDKILEAVGVQGQIIIEVIPELEKIIGKQPAVSELSGNAAQNRFNLLFGKFIQVFTSKEHPLVIFLDDLQWADSASLNLMKLLMIEASNSYLLMIGAYRDNEVFPAHPLMLTLNEIRKENAKINTITLAPLSENHINHLVADTLSCDEEVAKPLTELVYQKTKGNPFFTTQFLLGLYEDKLIRFNFEVGYWECDVSEVRQRALTDDVVYFMAWRLQKLPSETQEVVKLAACIGNQFDLKTLAIVCEQSKEDTANSLWKALQEGFILPQSQVYKFYIGQKKSDNQEESSQVVNYKFLHDRVQQAAYSLIAEDQKQLTHLKIGRQLWHNLSESEQENHLFTIVNHLNIGIDLIFEQEERNQIAQLNFQASQKAKISVAYESSRRYCYAGQKFLDEQSWSENYSLHFALAIATIEAEYFNHNLEVAQQLSQETLEKAQTLLDRIKIYELQILFEINQNKMNEAISLALDVLSMLDINISQEPKSIAAEIKQLREDIALPTEDIANLVTLTEVNDQEKLAAVRILTNATSAAYIVNASTFPAIVMHTVRHCMKYGHSPLAASAYSWYGALLCGVYGEIEAGYEFGKLSLQLLEKFNARSFFAKVSNMFNVFVRPWKDRLQNAVADLPQAIQGGFDHGDVEYAFYAAVHYCNYLFYSGSPLDNVHQAQERYLPVIVKAKYEFHEGFLRINQQAVSNLLGETEEPQFLQGTILDGEKFLSQCLENKIMFLVLCFYEAQTRLAYLFEDYVGALNAGEQGWQYREAARGTLYASEHNFYYSLALLASGKLDPEKSDRIAANQSQLKNWAEFAPTNFQHKYDIVEAEKHRLLGAKTEAIEMYDRAIAGAKENEYIQEEAIANELAAKFYLDWGKEKIASVYMQEAYYCYARWGAKAKTDDLEKRYPDLLRPILERVAQTLDPLETLSTIIQDSITSSQSSTSSLNNTLDLATVLKASQAISGIIELDELLRQLTQIILQHSGGNRCVLILPNSQEEWFVEAIANPESTEICSQPLENHPNVPIKLIQYVKNTQETVVVNDLETDLPIIDRYLLQKKPKSVLCLPILNQGHLIGILYLKNFLVSGAFTRERVVILNFLCTQAAIALENARLYEQSQAYSQKLEQSQLQIVQYEKMASLGNLMAGVAHEINNPLGFLNGSIKHAQENLHDILEHLNIYQNHYQLNYPDTAEVIEENAEEIDLDYLCEDMPKLLSSMKNATERIKNLSTSLRTFSRADTEYKVIADIHQGIDSTLMILKYRLKANQERPEIQVIKDYGDFSEVECFPGQLNQVFMNIIANGIDVFDEVAQNLSYSEIEAQPQKITIKTALLTKKNVVKIIIEDNGKGMTPEVKARIFDHLFTTKGVGKGTGLGLAIVRQIVVEKHGGTIDCVSELGKGTKFIITLPLT
ncbi:AAA family ATPase [Okeania sp.]|uniref:trifunctional serine/threonine-protein kinase/ATP-binding protein/sensor histidine kinase n=1 Tax=Okeania sp. TaxID=3100323 RepID=UPI002B4AD237|nr:AAA family ATPase [Okeania sp.]MEB3340929.1 AAA family ATPase [Okeania sp.]